MYQFGLDSKEAMWTLFSSLTQQIRPLYRPGIFCSHCTTHEEAFDKYHANHTLRDFAAWATPPQ